MEVVLSLGISSFALLLVLALILLSLDLMKEGREDAATAELLATVQHHIQSLSQSDLSSTSPFQRLYFDQQGREVPADQSMQSVTPPVYVAEVQPMSLTRSSLPGLSATSGVWALRIVVSSLASGQEVLRQSLHLTPME